jgi:hypothetical protein
MWIDKLTSICACIIVGPIIGHITHLTLGQSMTSVLLVMPHIGNYVPKMNTLVEKYNEVGFKIEMINYYLGTQANIVLMLLTNTIIIYTTTYYLVHN